MGKSQSKPLVAAEIGARRVDHQKQILRQKIVSPILDLKTHHIHLKKIEDLRAKKESFKRDLTIDQRRIVNEAIDDNKGLFHDAKVLEQQTTSDTVWQAYTKKLLKQLASDRGQTIPARNGSRLNDSQQSNPVRDDQKSRRPLGRMLTFLRRTTSTSQNSSTTISTPRMTRAGQAEQVSIDSNYIPKPLSYLDEEARFTRVARGDLDRLTLVENREKLMQLLARYVYEEQCFYNVSFWEKRILYHQIQTGNTITSFVKEVPAGSRELSLDQSNKDWHMRTGQKRISRTQTDRSKPMSGSLVTDSQFRQMTSEEKTQRLVDLIIDDLKNGKGITRCRKDSQLQSNRLTKLLPNPYQQQQRDECDSPQFKSQKQERLEEQILQEHPIKTLMVKMGYLIDKTYKFELEKLGLQISTDSNQNDFAASVIDEVVSFYSNDHETRETMQERQALNYSDKIDERPDMVARQMVSLQQLGKSAIEDIQDLLQIACQFTQFFYKRCITLDNGIFQQAIVETLTGMMLQANDGAVFDILKALFSAQHKVEISELWTQMSRNQSVKLSEMKVVLGLETFDFLEIEAHVQVQKIKKKKENELKIRMQQDKALQKGIQQDGPTGDDVHVGDDTLLPSIIEPSLELFQSEAQTVNHYEKVRTESEVPGLLISSQSDLQVRQHFMSSVREPKDVNIVKEKDRQKQFTTSYQNNFGSEVTCLLFSEVIEKLKKIVRTVKDPKEMMLQLSQIQMDVAQQWLAYEAAEKFSSQETSLRHQISESICKTQQELGFPLALFENLDSFIPAYEPEGDLTKSSQQYVVSLDVLLPCLIYVYTKAGVSELPAILSLIDNFTLENHQCEYDFVKSNLKAMTQFVRYEMQKLDQTTVRYTYADVNELEQKAAKTQVSENQF